MTSGRLRFMFFFFAESYFQMKCACNHVKIKDNKYLNHRFEHLFSFSYLSNQTRKTVFENEPNHYRCTTKCGFQMMLKVVIA